MAGEIALVIIGIVGLLWLIGVLANAFLSTNPFR